VPAQRILIHAFLALVAVQFFLGGLGVFRSNPDPTKKIVESSTFDAHRILGDVLTLIALVILVLAFVTRRALQLSAALFVLMVIQNLLAGFGEDTPVLGGLHALNALVIVAVGALLLMQSRVSPTTPQPSA
jgi:hypothetical protein